MASFVATTHSILRKTRAPAITIIRSPLRKHPRSLFASVRASASVSREEVKKTARLAQLQLSEDEISHITPEIQKFMGFVDRMSELDVDGVEPMARPHDAHNVTRADKARMFPNV